MALNTLAANTRVNKTFYDRVLLERLLPRLVWVKHGKKKSIPKREGSTIDFRKLNRFDPATTPLQSGITPTGSKFTISNLTATVAQYGDFKILTDAIDLIGIDPIVTEVLEAQGEQAAETLDTIVRDEVVRGTNAYYVGTNATERSEVAAGANLSGTVIRRIRQVMARNNVRQYPGARAYLAFIHPDVAYDIMGDDAWKNPNMYSTSGEAIFEGEIGKLYGIKFIESTLAPIFAGQGAGSPGIDVYGTTIIGDQAYGVVDIAGKSKPETIVKGLGEGDDPLNQRSSIGWKAWIVAVRLDELCILRVESAASVGALA